MTRDYNLELSDQENAFNEKYAYQFDFDVMHPLMLRKLIEHRSSGKVLEVGSHYGIFTEKILDHYPDLTCVEVSTEAFQKLKTKIGNRAVLHNAAIESIEGLERYDIIIMTHVLEHVDNPIQILQTLSKYLTPSGIIFVVVPSATAASRQIAVEMGLIPHLTAVTEAEKQHGHQRTYTLDTLKRDAREAGLLSISVGGIFFKGLANFQFDQAISAGIVNASYLDACYSLGDKYPELCASLFLVGTGSTID
jgi:2-polyprenyl-3-methyl-5-hydroxy-6-metoxy-1,4-benzoquinol methylase